MAQPLGFTNAIAVTKSDTVPVVAVNGVAVPVSIYVGTTGTLIVITVGGQTITFSGVAGTILPVKVTHVKTGGTATDLQAVY